MPFIRAFISSNFPAHFNFDEKGFISYTLFLTFTTLWANSADLNWYSGQIQQTTIDDSFLIFPKKKKKKKKKRSRPFMQILS